MCRFSECLTFFISCLFLVCLIRNNCLLLILKSSNVLTLLYRWGSFLAKFPENNVVVRKPRYMELPDKEPFDSSDISVNAQNFSENLDTQKNLYGNSKNHISLFFSTGAYILVLGGLFNPCPAKPRYTLPLQTV